MTRNHQQTRDPSAVRRGKLLTDKQLSLVVGGVMLPDSDTADTRQIDNAINELNALTGDPEALERKMKELLDQGLLEGVVEVLSGTTGAGAAPAEGMLPEAEQPELQINGAEAPSGGGEIPAVSAPEQTGGLVIHHNLAAINTLTQLQNNQGSVSKSLEKLSSGMKINSAADDPSGYQITQRMRTQITALDQANYNAMNGRSMLKVAEGSVSSTVEILRALKEKCINAVNDTATEVDRAAIQKEIEQAIQQIDDNALLTFNGKFLDNGARTSMGEQTQNVMFTEQQQGNGADSLPSSLTDRNATDPGVPTADSLTLSFVKDGRIFTETVPVSARQLSDLFAVNNSADGTGIDEQISAIKFTLTDQNGGQISAADGVLNSFTEAIEARNASGDPGIALEIGANANQRMNLSLDDMRASALGLSGKGATVSVADKTSATAALKVIDNALQRALNQEASIGAVMNRLEFTSNNLSTSSENLQSAESTYRDADMAKEMTEFTKNNILMQAATAMLAQANTQNNGVLSLLQ